MELKAKAKLPLHISSVSNTLCPTHVLIFIYFLLKAYGFLRFWCLMLKGEKLLGQSKRTSPPPCFIFQIGTIVFAKTLLRAKSRKTIYAIGENFFRGNFYLTKGKAFEKGGEYFKLENAFQKFYYYILGQLQMNLKRFYQKSCNNKLSGANMVHNFNYVKNIHMYLELLLLQ
jgi:hypothetical protein